MAIQVTEKKKETKLPKGVDLLFHFAIALFILVGAAYFATMYLNVKAEETKAEIKQRIEEKKAEIPEKEELEKKAQSYFHLIEDFKLIANNQKITSPFFVPFEEMIHPEVAVFDLSFNLSGGEGMLLGEGKDLLVVGQQFYALKNNEDISDVNLSSLTISEEETVVGFSFTMKFKNEIFKQKIDD